MKEKPCSYCQRCINGICHQEPVQMSTEQKEYDTLFCGIHNNYKEFIIVENATITLYLRSDYVTCTQCECNYSACTDDWKKKENKRFCQKKSFPIDPNDDIRNMIRARECDMFFPQDIGRVHASKEYGKNHKTWYEELD